MQSLDGWRQDNPMRRIESIQVVESAGVVRGLVLLWSLFEQLQEVSKIAHFTIDEEIREQYGHEYAEALMLDAIGFAAENRSPDKSVVLITHRRVVIVIIRPDGQAYVRSLDKFLDSIEDSIAQEISKQFEQWQNTGEPGFLVVLLPDQFHFGM